jgi:hypothetical protein
MRPRSADQANDAKSARKPRPSDRSDSTCSRDDSGWPSISTTWHPIASDGLSFASRTASSNAALFAISVAEVTIPRRCASMIARLTPGVRPKSSAFTMSWGTGQSTAEVRDCGIAELSTEYRVASRELDECKRVSVGTRHAETKNPESRRSRNSGSQCCRSLDQLCGRAAGDAGIDAAACSSVCTWRRMSAESEAFGDDFR